MAPEDHGNLLKQELERLRVKEVEQQEIIEALRSEFSKADTPEKIVETARAAIVDLMPKAVVQMGILVEHAESESVRAGLSRFIIGTALDKTKFEDTSSGELKELLRQLAANDS